MHALKALLTDEHQQPEWAARFPQDPSLNVLLCWDKSKIDAEQILTDTFYSGTGN